MIKTIKAVGKKLPLWLLAFPAVGLYFALAPLATDVASHGLYWVKINWKNEDALRDESILQRPYRIVHQAQPVEGVTNNLSGLTYDHDRDHLWAVVNSPTQLLALSKTGEVLSVSALEGFEDTEAVAYLGDDLLAVVEERQQTIVAVPIPAANQPVNREGLRHLTLELAEPENNEFEGLSYDASTDRLFLVRERRPIRLYEISGFKSSLGGDLNLSIREHHNLAERTFFARDLSSVHHDSNTGNLLLLSDESRIIIEMDPEGRIVNYQSLRSGNFGGLKRAIPQAEGMAMDHSGNLYLVSEPNLFYRFDRQ